MPDAINPYSSESVAYTAQTGLAAGEVIQLPDGRAGVIDKAVSSGGLTAPYTGGVWQVAKTAGSVILNGGRVYWDASANAATYKKVNDRDFYLGRAVGDSTSASTTMYVALNIDPPYDLDLIRDPWTTVIVGGATLTHRGGLVAALSSTSEAQKVDALSVAAFAAGTNAIIEFAFRVVNDGAGSAADLSMGVANATHADNADSITESVFIHLNANDVNIYAESDDGTVEVNATDTTINYTEGSSISERVEVWMDLRDPADVQIYVNGSLVLDGTTFNVSVAAGPWKLLMHLEKTSAADVYEVALDWMRARFME